MCLFSSLATTGSLTGEPAEPGKQETAAALELVTAVAQELVTAVAPTGNKDREMAWLMIGEAGTGVGWATDRKPGGNGSLVELSSDEDWAFALK